MGATDWMDRAACKGHPAGWWWPDGGEGTANHGAAGKQICATCPVLAPCLDGAVERREHSGIFGGAGEDVRRQFQRLRKLRTHTEPGPVDRCRCEWCRELRNHVKVLRVGQQKPTRPPVRNRNGKGATHGRRVTHARGCRCDGCLWSATKVGQALTRAGMDTSVFWTTWAPPDVTYAVSRQVVNEAALEAIDLRVRALLAALGLASAWPQLGLSRLRNGE